MSVKVAVVCEDHTIDQYILKPVISSCLSHLGRRQARVFVVTNPQLRGIGDLKREAPRILRAYAPVADAVVFAADADCKDGRYGREDVKAQLWSQLAREAQGGKAVVVVAVQELEVWALWGHRGVVDASWREVREECNPKERFFEGLLEARDLRLPDRGRTRLIAASLDMGWRSLTSGCSELQDLECEMALALTR